MKLEELLKGCSLRAAAGDLGVEILGLAYDSRRVRPGDAFFAIRGTRIDGNRFVPNAIEKGAAAIVSALPATRQISMPWIEVDDERVALARMAGNFYGHPTAQLHLIGHQWKDDDNVFGRVYFESSEYARRRIWHDRISGRRIRFPGGTDNSGGARTGKTVQTSGRCGMEVRRNGSLFARNRHETRPGTAVRDCRVHEPQP